MGRHKYRKRKSESYEYVNQTAEGSGLFDFAKNLTKKTAEAALKKGTLKLSEKAGRKLGEKAVDSFFKKNQVFQTGEQSSLVKNQLKVKTLLNTSLKMKTKTYINLQKNQDIKFMKYYLQLQI